MTQIREPHDRPGVASAEQGIVLLDGPDGVAVAMTPDAAEATGHSLVTAAGEARSGIPASPPPEPD